MNPVFASLVESLEPRYQELKECKPFTFNELASRLDLPKQGVYLFSEDDTSLYVGRSDLIRKRLQSHCRPSSAENQAAFAFLLARRESGFNQPTYRGEGSRKHLMQQASFRGMFELQKARIRAMDIRVVAESDPNRQALLEMYVAVVEKTHFNTFGNH